MKELAGVVHKRASRFVYAAIDKKASFALKVGHSVMTDATFLDPAQRVTVEQFAHDCSATATGLWLTAPIEQLYSRAAARRNDGSDADAKVINSQLSAILV